MSSAVGTNLALGFEKPVTNSLKSSTSSEAKMKALSLTYDAK
jgi:hypothetical protein